MRSNIVIGAILVAMTMTSEAGTTRLLLSPPNLLLKKGSNAPIQVLRCSGRDECPVTITITSYDPKESKCYGYIDYGVIIARSGFFGGYPLLVWNLTSQDSTAATYAFDSNGIDIRGTVPNQDFDSGGYHGGVGTKFHWQSLALKSLAFQYDIHLTRTDTSGTTKCDLEDPIIINRGD